MFTNTLSRLFDLELIEPSPPGKEGHAYRYALFEQLPDMHADSSKPIPVPPLSITSIDNIYDSNVKKRR